MSVNSPPVFRVRYWGVTGSIARTMTPDDYNTKLVDALQHLMESGVLAELIDSNADRTGIEKAIYSALPFELRSTFGGNTTSFEVQTRDSQIIVDAGTGLRNLDEDLMQRWDDPSYNGPRQADVLLTHAHSDHTFCTPFARGFFDPRNEFSVWGAKETLASLDAVLSTESMLRSVYFPPTYELLKGVKHFHEVTPGSDFQLGETTVRTFILRHPGMCLAYKLEREGKCIVFASDHEIADGPDEHLAEFARGADLLYLDGQYLAAEYEGRVGIAGGPPVSRKQWGHATIEAAVMTGIAANVGQLHIGHHDPARSDQELAELQRYAQGIAGQHSDGIRVAFAREGLKVDLV